MIIDRDPGHDGCDRRRAARHANVLGVTTVAGNAPVTATTRNAQIILDLIGSPVEVHQGAERPLVAEARHAAYVHGESGLDGADLPEPSRGPVSHDAVRFIIETCRKNEGAWLVPTGPLTNIALALRTAPDLASRIAGISLMGGGTFGNRSTVAEFNIWADPEAAAIVFDYGGPLIMSGLNVTHRLQATPERISQVRALPGRLAEVLADLFDFFTNVRRCHTHARWRYDPCQFCAHSPHTLRARHHTW